MATCKALGVCITCAGFRAKARVPAQVVVHGLPYSMEWQDLKDLVKPYSSGTVRVDIAKGYDGRSRGYGTVLFDTADDARSCIQVCLLGTALQACVDDKHTVCAVSACLQAALACMEGCVLMCCVDMRG